ncbi:HD domain-containing protein [Aquimarina longa]|uniref:HD domain-containing protein n=1 Tax=Aquimarina longa TaxID=1080221 RepID=UPI000781AA66|nr:HD domain-containing protein [Aquimarina longa]
MRSNNIIAKEIISIYKKHGHIEYGEQCSMLSHSVQTGLIAKEKGYDRELILSGFLHDIGHLTPLEFQKDELKTMGDFGIDAHDKWGEIYLKEKGFSNRVIAPVANHVKSKRYLCFIDPLYFNRLSFASKKTLEYQGGIMNKEEASNFEKELFFLESIVIRKAEEEAKIKNFVVLDSHLEYFQKLM